ncbi:MAG: 8-amino-7-oxononanoate synthase [Bacteroidota bacterium]
MEGIEQNLALRLAQRQQQGLLRQLVKIPAEAVDFCSNDYLGIGRVTASPNASLPSATGSRLISGNSQEAEQLEAYLAEFHWAQAGLLFNSGYDANLGLWSCIAGPEDTILTDELVHASIIDGVRLSKAKRAIFRHNDLAYLESLLQEAQGNVFIGTESVFSMDGDICPLVEMAELAKRYGAGLIVDEAHSNGIVGPQGRGLICELGLKDSVFARVHTFGKAVGRHGAIVLGSDTLKQYLLNFARSFIFTTALPPRAVAEIGHAYQLVEAADEARIRLQALVNFFVAQRQQSPWRWLASKTWIQSVIIPGNQQVRRVARALEQQGFALKPIVSPTVPAGTERIRICLHSYNQEEEIARLFDSLNLLHHKLCEDTSSLALAQK